MCKVTIAIPVYNVEDYIEKSLLSALNQTFEDIEFLIIDDKSTDTSMEIVKRIRSTHPRGNSIRIIDHVVNKGLATVRNTAIDNASGEYLYFMDSDDIVAPETISKLYDVIIRENADIVEGSYQVCSNRGDILEKHIWSPIKVSGDFAICNWMKKCRIYYDGYAWNKLYNLRFLSLNNVRCIDSQRNEDVFFSFQVVIYAKSFVTISDITYNYLMRPGSIVNQGVDDIFYMHYLDIFIARTNLIKGMNWVSPPNIIFNYYLQHFFEWWLRFVLYGNFTRQKKQFFYETLKEMYTLNFSTKDLIGLRYKIMYNLMKLSNYRYIRIFYSLDILAAKCYNRLNRHFHIFKLPYSHL